MDENYNERLKKERVRIMMNKEQHGSVFGLTKTETAFLKTSQESNFSSALVSD